MFSSGEKGKPRAEAVGKEDLREPGGNSCTTIRRKGEETEVNSGEDYWPPSYGDEEDPNGLGCYQEVHKDEAHPFLPIHHDNKAGVPGNELQESNSDEVTDDKHYSPPPTSDDEEQVPSY